MTEEQEILFSQIKSDAEKLHAKIQEYGDEYIGDISMKDFGLLSDINNALCNLLGID